MGYWVSTTIVFIIEIILMARDLRDLHFSIVNSFRLSICNYRSPTYRLPPINRSICGRLSIGRCRSR